MEEQYGIRQGAERVRDFFGGIIFGGAILLGVSIMVGIGGISMAYHSTIGNRRYARFPHKIKIPKQLRKLEEDWPFSKDRIEIRRIDSGYEVRQVNNKTDKVLAQVLRELIDVDEIPNPLSYGPSPIEVKHYGTTVIFPSIKNRFGHSRTIDVRYDDGSTYRSALSVATKIADYSRLRVEDHSQETNLEKRVGSA